MKAPRRQQPDGTQEDEEVKILNSTKKRYQSPYPALAAWKRRSEHPRKFETWKYDDPWRAACCEAEAAENAKDHPKRENDLQREAISFMLGVPMHKVKLDLEWQRKYLAALEAGE